MNPGNSRFYQENLKELKKYHPHLLTQLDKVDSSGVRLETISTDLKNLLTLSGKPVYSPRNPMKTAERMVSSIRGEDFDVLILMGFGLGYIAELILRESFLSARGLVIVEPLIGCFQHAMLHTSLVNTFRREGTCFIVGNPGDDELQRYRDIVDPLIVNRIRTLRHPVLYDEYKDAYILLENMLKNILDERISDRMTFSKFGKLWIDNIFQNTLTAIKKNIPMVAEPNHVDTIILAGAGPELDTNLAKLQSFQDSIPIACVDSAIPTLRANNIQPSIALSIDPQEACKRFFDNSMAKNVSTIVSFLSTPGILREVHTPLCLCRTGHPLENYFFGKEGFLIDTGGGSVVNSLLDIVLRMKPKIILLIGIDFGFPDKKIYTLGYPRDEQSFNKFQTREHESRIITRNSTCPPVLNNSGQMIQTTHALNRYRQALEKTIHAHPEINFINTSLRGAKIDGADFIPFENWADTSGGRKSSSTLNYTYKPLKPENLFVRLKSSINSLEEISGFYKTPGISAPSRIKFNQKFPGLIGIIETLVLRPALSRKVEFQTGKSVAKGSEKSISGSHEWINREYMNSARYLLSKFTRLSESITRSVSMR